MSEPTFVFVNMDDTRRATTGLQSDPGPQATTSQDDSTPSEPSDQKRRRLDEKPGTTSNERMKKSSKRLSAIVDEARMRRSQNLPLTDEHTKALERRQRVNQQKSESKRRKKEEARNYMEPPPSSLLPSTGTIFKVPPPPLCQFPMSINPSCSLPPDPHVPQNCEQHPDDLRLSNSALDKRNLVSVAAKGLDPERVDEVLEIFPQPLTYSVGLPENAWLRDVLSQWNSGLISGNTRQHVVGKAIIEKLLTIPTPLPQVPCDGLIIFLGKPKRGSIPPSPKLVMVDLLEEGEQNVCEFYSRNSETGINGLDVLASIVMVTTSTVDMNSPERRFYGALDIPMTKHGLDMCKYEAFPYNQEKRCFLPKKAWTTTFTPPGAITHIHMDYYGRHQYMIHLFGCKLWLLWPPTESNLQKIASFHAQYPETDLTLSCIDDLEGLQVFYATEEQAFVLKPNVLHACLCLGTSAHCGTWVWMLSAYEESFRMLNWGLDWIKRKLSTDAPAGDYKGELETLRSEVDSWRELAKANPGDMDSVNVEKHIDAFDNEFSKVVGLFNPSKRTKKKKNKA